MCTWPLFAPTGYILNNGPQATRPTTRGGSVFLRAFQTKLSPYTHIRCAGMCIWTHFASKRASLKKTVPKRRDSPVPKRFRFCERFKTNRYHIHISAVRKGVYGDGLTQNDQILRKRHPKDTSHHSRWKRFCLCEHLKINRRHIQISGRCCAPQARSGKGPAKQRCPRRSLCSCAFRSSRRRPRPTSCLRRSRPRWPRGDSRSTTLARRLRRTLQAIEERNAGGGR